MLGPGAAPAAMEYIICADGDGRYRWWLRAQNGRLLATCVKPLKTKAGCLIDIGHVKRSQYAPTIPADRPPVSVRETPEQAAD